MEITLPLDKMSVADKISIMKKLWSDLCQHANEMQSPAWHNNVLLARKKNLEKGKDRFLDWKNAKQYLKDKTK